MIVVSDTSLISYLIQINEIHLLQRLFQSVIVTVRVYEELCSIEDQKKWLASESTYWIEVKQASNKELVKRFNNVLDRGGIRSYCFGNGIKCRVILIDEWKGRNTAKKKD